jgi:DNA-binding IscR family transcriptional regulator
LSKQARCLTHDLWAGLGETIYGFLNAISLADVIDGNPLPSLLPTHEPRDLLNLVQEAGE